MTDLYYPLRSLQEGHWFKLICGASYQHLPAVRNLALTYALAGADCVDVAADPAVVSAAKAGLEAADRLSRASQPRPWLMVSFNDGEDPHFRKAEFDPLACPPDCSRPCESICPAQAIVFPSLSTNSRHELIHSGSSQEIFAGVLNDRCYGCGRCLPLCPTQQISTRSHVASPATIAPLVLQAGIDAIEIHTQVGRVEAFRQLWTTIAPWTARLKLVAVSCPDGEGLIAYLRTLYEILSPLPCALLWQTDGRPMSGDIGAGATRTAVKLGQKVLAAGLPGFVQLAGGTNHHTVPKLRSLGLLSDRARGRRCISGVAYGSYARSLLLPVLNQLEEVETQHLEAVPPLLHQAVELANSLVSQLKPSSYSVPALTDFCCPTSVQSS